MNIVLPRLLYAASYTQGMMLVNGAFFCYTLEDTVRPAASEKVYGATAIPAGRYRVVVDQSPKFQKLMPHILDVPGFEGVRIHGGESDADTEGCILTGSSFVRPDDMVPIMSEMTTHLLQSQPEEHWIEIIDTAPYTGIPPVTPAIPPPPLPQRPTA